MQARLDRGLELLQSGERALMSGLVDDGVEAFTEALRAFRVPELRLGEARAMRGLALAMLHRGEIDEALRRARQAVEAFESLSRFVNPVAGATQAAPELARGVEEGWAAARVLLAEVLVRRGEDDEAGRLLAQIEGQPDVLAATPSAGAAYAALGRLAVRRGEYAAARRAYERALEMHGRAESLSGQVSTFLLLAELHRLQGDLVSAEAVLNLAALTARAAGKSVLEGRVFSAMGALMLQLDRADDARRCYREALPLLRGAGDSEVEAFTLLGLGDAERRTDRPGAVALLLDGVRLLCGLGHQHGVAGGLLRIAEYGARHREHVLVLAAAESARQLWAQSDPVRGVGQSLRLVVKALAGLEQWEVAFLAAEARARIAGHLQPNALDVQAWYRERTPASWIERVEGMETAALLALTEARVASLLAPSWEEMGVEPPNPDDLRAVLEAVETLVGLLPQPVEAEREVPPEDDVDAHDTDVFQDHDDLDGSFYDAPIDDPPNDDPPEREEQG